MEISIEQKAKIIATYVSKCRELTGRYPSVFEIARIYNQSIEDAYAILVIILGEENVSKEHTAQYN